MQSCLAEQANTAMLEFPPFLFYLFYFSNLSFFLSVCYKAATDIC